MISFARVDDAKRLVEQALSLPTYKFSVANLVATIFILAGMEIEGKQISLTLLSGVDASNDDKGMIAARWNVVESAPSELICEWRSDQADTFARNIRAIVGACCSASIQTNPALVVTHDGKISEIVLLKPNSNLTNFKERLFSIVITPGWAAWIANQKGETYQWLRLRDGTGFVLRELKAIESKFARLMQPTPKSGALPIWTARAILELSQQGIGGALYFAETTSSYARFSVTRNLVARSIGSRSHVTCHEASTLKYFLGFDGAVLCHVKEDAICVSDWGVYFHGPGGRHKTAEHITRTESALYLAVIISQDGAITAYDRTGTVREISDWRRFI